MGGRERVLGKKFVFLPYGLCQVPACVGDKLLQGSDLGSKPGENVTKKRARHSAGPDFQLFIMSLLVSRLRRMNFSTSCI
jgi:hypothetical protein